MKNKTPKLISLKKLTDLKWVNLYKSVHTISNGKEVKYNFITRRDSKHMGKSHTKYVDAVKVLPYFEKDDQTFIIINKEFRYPLNDYVYDICSGLVENQNDLVGDVKRELWEELGATPIKIEKVANVGSVSPGLTDETQECYEAQINPDMTCQHLEISENITNIVVPLDKLLDYINSHQFVLSASLMLQLFYYKHKK
ncbi:MAG: NUDIX hydrolase [Clostridia bacterium]|nr:NUDIX hydrolase [Clostridia bacterium]